MVELSTRCLDRVPAVELEPGNRLLAGYWHGGSEVCALFAHARGEEAALARHPRAQSDRAALAAVLERYQAHLGAGQVAREHARLLADPATPVITVGQQSGLLTGPLYTAYKAITAIAVARRLTREGGRPVVPVFWAATDDDDRGEADHTGIWDAHYRLLEVRYPSQAGDPGQLIGDLPCLPAGREIVAQFTAACAGLPCTEEITALLRATLEESADLGEWYCRLMSRLFSELGLVLCDPRLPEIRRLGMEVLRREISAPLRTTDLVNRQARVLQQRGFPPALIKPADTCNFFLLDGMRRRVIYQQGRYHAGEASYTAPEMLALLEEDPDRLLPNAVLRPVVQEYLFGSAAFIAGPHELGYWAELASVFAALDVDMPVVLPRAGATLAPAPIARRLRDWGVPPHQLLLHADQVRLAWLERQQPPGLAQLFTGARDTVHQVTDALAAGVAQLDPTLAPAALAARQRMANELERLERKTLKAVERQSGEFTERFAHVREVLFPGHHLQERALNLCSILARRGMHFPAELLDLLDGQEGYHVFVEI